MCNQEIRVYTQNFREYAYSIKWSGMTSKSSIHLWLSSVVELVELMEIKYTLSLASKLNRFQIIAFIKKW